MKFCVQDIFFTDDNFYKLKKYIFQSNHLKHKKPVHILDLLCFLPTRCGAIWSTVTRQGWPCGTGGSEDSGSPHRLKIYQNPSYPRTLTYTFTQQGSFQKKFNFNLLLKLTSLAMCRKMVQIWACYSLGFYQYNICILRQYLLSTLRWTIRPLRYIPRYKVFPNNRRSLPLQKKKVLGGTPPPIRWNIRQNPAPVYFCGA